MTIIHVTPRSVFDYGTKAQEIFTSIHAALEANVNELVAIQYDGPNAANFKRQVGALSASFANDLHLDLVAMASAVQTATSNIAMSLGGAKIGIEIPGKPITVPPVTEADFVDVDTTALAAGIQTVNTQFNQLRDQLSTHETALNATEWLGNAKDTAVGVVKTRTKTATEKCNDAETAIITAITQQLDAVHLADGAAPAA